MNKIKQKELDYTWGLFINSNYANNISNANKDKYIQLRDKLQKEINEKGYADLDNPELAEWWMKPNEKEI